MCGVESVDGLGFKAEFRIANYQASVEFVLYVQVTVHRDNLRIK